MVTPSLIQTILEQYTLPRFGTHGISHWARVYEIGLGLTGLTGANPKVVQLFAVFHDSKRLNEAKDNGHGKRGAEFARSLRGSLINLDDSEFDLLYRACSFHTDGLVDEDITVQTCWDSDRLDLNRVPITPDPEQLCTSAAKDPSMLTWAIRRSKAHFKPDIIQTQWGVNG